ncbi:acyl carrier protein [Chitinophaga varians]|uniref:acyl carrier protein n=1 Tax=Chitinophaga varians TaxID=2202339 RepID=UPI00165F7862|nr:acyl carrier protein [Chitinophaga varians]MBC9910596.1 acyl carrier protein [Chitinophaga varians]
MEITTFVASFADLFDETPKSEIGEGTDFKQIEEWSSLLGLATIAMVDENYGVRISGDEIRESGTITDLFNLVKKKAAEK